MGPRASQDLRSPSPIMAPGSNVTRDVHWCVTVGYQQIENDNIANQIDEFTIDYGKFILKADKPLGMLVEHSKNS